MKKYGLYDPKLHAYTDWFLFHKIALFEGAIYIPETLSTMRLHSNSFSAQCTKNHSIEKSACSHLLSLLKQNRELCQKFKKAALLGFIFKKHVFECLKSPKLWAFYPYLIRKSLKYRLKL